MARKMAVQRTLICLAATALLMQLAMAANYTVGGPNGGWDASTDLQTWANSQSFSVGDNLIFQYTANHDVIEVSKADYDNCQTGNAIQTYNGGNTVITLSSPGKKYFTCGTPGHCAGGMKLEIDTLATSSPPPSSPTNPPPQASPSTPRPAASPVSPPVSSPSPAHSPKTAPTVSPTSPSSSPSDSLSPPNVPSTEVPTTTTASPPGTTAPPPGSSSATKGVSKTTVTMGFSLGMLMLLTL